MKDFYTIKEVSDMTGLRPSSIRKYISLGQIRSAKVGATNIIYQQDLRDWLSRRRPKKKISTVLGEVAEDDKLSIEEKMSQFEKILKVRGGEDV